MTRKTTAAYAAVFKYIEGNVFKLKPARFMTDFEGGMRKAINDCYPNVVLLGCWYHYCAAVRSKARSLGLHNILKNNWNAMTIYKKLLSLPLLTSDKIIDGFMLIEQETINLGLHRDFEELLTYFKSFWLQLVQYNYYYSLKTYHKSIHPSL